MLKIIFEFAGGPLDGKTVVGALSDNGEASRYYLLTNHGAIGQSFKVASDYAVETLANEQLQVETPHTFQHHVYVVSQRVAVDTEVFVRVEYVPSQSGRESDRESDGESDGESGRE